MAQGHEDAPGIAFRPVVDRMIEAVIVPGFSGLAVGVARRASSMDDLCLQADAKALAQARTTESATMSPTNALPPYAASE